MSSTSRYNRRSTCGRKVIRSGEIAQAIRSTFLNIRHNSSWVNPFFVHRTQSCAPLLLAFNGRIWGPSGTQFSAPYQLGVTRRALNWQHKVCDENTVYFLGQKFSSDSWWFHDYLMVLTYASPLLKKWLAVICEFKKLLHFEVDLGSYSHFFAAFFVFIWNPLLMPIRIRNNYLHKLHFLKLCGYLHVIAYRITFIKTVICICFRPLRTANFSPTGRSMATCNQNSSKMDTVLNAFIEHSNQGLSLIGI